MSETGFWQSRQDRDFQNHNPFFETGIETLKTPITFSRLGLRLLICQSLFRDWDQDLPNSYHFFDTEIETDKLEGIKTFEDFQNANPFDETGIKTQKWRGITVIETLGRILCSSLKSTHFSLILGGKT